MTRTGGLLVPLALAVLACATSRAVSTGTTRIVSDPPGARVFVDDALVGETPVTVQLEKRTHRIRLEKDGFDPATRYISVHERDDPLLSWFIAQVTLSGEYDSKYEFDESYRYVLVPAAMPQ
ncbi:MAG TPA: PEGA domain-containing protein [Myxococcota bacterium]|nr:PEGA domain-containing protein [Myxococcota bacterium]